MPDHSRPFRLVTVEAESLYLEPISAAHDVTAFSCGDSDGALTIAAYLRERALTEHNAGLNSVTLAVDSGTREVVGYFTLSPLSISVSPHALGVLGLNDVPYARVGGFLLGRLGVVSSRQRTGIGKELVVEAVARATAARDEHGVGGAFVAVDPKTDRLVDWYTSLGFVRLEPSKQRVVRRLERPADR